MPAAQRIDERGLSKLKWRCRRGLLENDLFIQRFFERFETSLTENQAQSLLILMDLSDNDLLDLLLCRTELDGVLIEGSVPEVLQMLRMLPPAVESSSPNRPNQE